MPAELRAYLTGRGARRGDLITALRRVITDSGTFFGLPAPARARLEQDMAALKLTSQRDYIVWLLMERHRLVTAPRTEAA
ncbi:MAG: hypothetical protein QM817_40730 [Archangium sp.]